MSEMYFWRSSHWYLFKYLTLGDDPKEIAAPKAFKGTRRRSLGHHSNFYNLEGASSSPCAEKDVKISQNFR